MVDELGIETPEHIELRLELAGIASRFFAGVLDLAIQVGGLLLVAVVSLGGLEALRWPTLSMQSGWALAGLILAAFFTFFGYPIVFEMLWNGQSPGKRLVQLRVMRDDGTPLTFFDSAIRNILRSVDFLPVAYAVGLFTMFFHAQYKRLGDVVAGTIVVKDKPAPVGALGAPAQGAPPWPQAEAAIRPHLAGVRAREVRACREFLERRGTLEAASRIQVAAALATPLLERFGLTEWRSAPASYEAFLEGLVAAYDAREASRHSTTGSAGGQRAGGGGRRG